MKRDFSSRRVDEDKLKYKNESQSSWFNDRRL